MVTMNQNYEHNFNILLHSVETKHLIVRDVIIGILDDDTLVFLESMGVIAHTREIHITAKRIAHLQRDFKVDKGSSLTLEEIANFPSMILMPDVILFNSEDKKLNLLFASKENDGERYNKIVIDPLGYDKKSGQETIVLTAGKVEKYNLKEKKYVVIKGSI
jgi:hypothetical protein